MVTSRDALIHQDKMVYLLLRRGVYDTPDCKKQYALHYVREVVERLMS